MKAQVSAHDEQDLTELEIGSDGRIYVFGASPEVLEILHQIALTDDALRERVNAPHRAAHAGEAVQQPCMNNRERS